MIRIFRHYIPTYLIVLNVSEFALLLASFFLSIFLQFGEGRVGLKLLSQPLLPQALFFTVVVMLLLTATGLYQRGLRDGILGILSRIVVALILAIFLLGLLVWSFPQLYVGRYAFILFFAFSFAGLVVSRLIFEGLEDVGQLQHRILVLGTGDSAKGIQRSLRRKVDRRGIHIEGYVHLPNDHDVIEPEQVVKPDGTLLELCEERNVDELVIAIDDRRKGFPINQILDCKFNGVHVVDLLTFMERQTGRIPLELLQPGSMIFLDGFSQATLKTYSKRIFDIAASLGILVVTFPFMLLTTLAIMAECRGTGPVFYRQERVGRGGEPFDVLKFRSMRVDAEQAGVAQWAVLKDPRVTLVGAFIRKTRIDELPQILNVLKGDMSFVGPRPERPMFVDALEEKIPYYGLRHQVNPGITGWAQICYPYGASEHDAREKLQYDLYYLKNFSLFLDLMILFQTAQVILWGKGAR